MKTAAAKILILSDIHANVAALESIAEPHDEMWVLGDLVNQGPQPSEAMDFVCKDASVVVSGNHDFATGTENDPQCSPAFREMARTIQQYTESILTEAERAWLRGLSKAARRDADGKRFFLCHATPSDPLFRYAPADTAFRARNTAPVRPVMRSGTTARLPCGHSRTMSTRP